MDFNLGTLKCIKVKNKQADVCENSTVIYGETPFPSIFEKQVFQIRFRLPCSMYIDWPYSFTLQLIIALGQKRIKITVGLQGNGKNQKKK